MSLDAEPPMPLPVRVTHCAMPGAKGRVMVELTSRGLRVDGASGPRLDLLVTLWDMLVQAMALGEVDVADVVGVKGAARRVAEARAALQVHLRGR